MTYREFADWAKDSVRKISASFDKPDDDWDPVALVEGGDGQAIIVALVMDKRDYPAAVSVIVEKTKARKVALVTSAWGLEFANREEGEAWNADPEALPPSQHPDGFEQVVVSVFDAERVEAWSAKILRDGEQPPGLAEWDWGGAEVDGPMVGPIREALR